jgi:hypothetical protein
MDKDNALVQVTPDDIAFVEQELAKTRKPATMRELAEKLAFRKTANERTQDVKLYDQTCVYRVGDSIYKEYDEPLTVSSKTVEPFKGPVVLTVVHKIFYKGFGEMLEVDYTGGGTFRKYIDYMKKSKTQVLLPSNVGGANEEPQVMGRENDPRLTELPMLDKDLKTLERHLRIALAKSPAFFAWGDFWQLTANRPSFPEDKIKEMEAQFTATKESAATGDLVKKFFGLEASSDLFDIHCLGLAHLLEIKYKKEFVQVSPLDWGKWHLKSVLNAMPENLALSAPEAALPEFDSPEQVEAPPFHAFPLKVYLSCREILSGGVKIPKAFNKDLAHSREYVFTDADDNKGYIVYYFPQQGYFLGLKAFFAAANIPQGTSMTLERKGPLQFHFWLKKSKKKISVAKLSYDPAADMFADANEAATLAMPNKIIYLERDTLVKLIARYGERDALNLKDLIILVFKHFSLPGASHAMHYLRAYHLVDVLKRTSQEDVEFTLLNMPEFSKSDKKKGIYAYHEALPALEEIQIEASAAATGKSAAEVQLDEFEAVPGTPVDVIQEGDLDEFEFEIIAPPAPPTPIPEIKVPTPPPAPLPAAGPDEAKKEKPHKKKKAKLDGEKAPKAKKSERRVIEERIEEQESELEALYAEKSQDEEEIETFEAARTEAAVEKAKEAPVEAGAEQPAAEEAKPAAPPEPGGMFGNLFAERLKSALTKKRQEVAEKKSEDKE